MKKKVTFLMLALALISVLAYYNPTVTLAASSSATDVAEIETLIKQTYQDALAEGNADAIIDIYAEESVMMPQGVATAEGLRSIRKIYEGIFSGIVLDLQFTIDEVTVSANYAIARSTSSGTALIKATGETAPDANRELWVMRKIDGKWKILSYMFNKTGE